MIDITGKNWFMDYVGNQWVESVDKFGNIKKEYIVKKEFEKGKFKSIHFEQCMGK